MSEFSTCTGRVIENDLPLTEYLGGASNCAVFRTTYSGQNAAIKLLAVTDAGAQLAHLEAAAKLSHPNLLRILHFGRTQLDDSDFIYVVTEFAEENLSQVLPDRALTVPETRQVVATVLDVLAYLHEQGFVHADLKPANIMASNDQLKLSIDGVHRIGEPLSREPGSHDAPEAAQALTPASDFWSLGLTLVEVLTQKLPPKPVSENAGPAVAESVPAPFREIAQHCLLRTPELRWGLAEIDNKLNGRAPGAPVPVEKTADEQKKVPAAAPQQAGRVPGPFAPLERAGSSPTRPSSKRPLIAIGLVALVVAAIVAIPRLSERKSETPTPSAPAASSDTTPASTSQPGKESSAPTSSAEQATKEYVTPAPVENKPAEAQPAEPIAASAPPPASAAHEPPPSNVKHISDEPVADTNVAADNAVHDASADSAPQPGVVQQPMPQVIPQAQRSISGTVRVKLRLNVDPAGNVVDSQFVSAGPSRYFSRSAMDAARRWKFASGSEARVYNLEFDFRRSGTEVHTLQQR